MAANLRKYANWRKANPEDVIRNMEDIWFPVHGPNLNQLEKCDQNHKCWRLQHRRGCAVHCLQHIYRQLKGNYTKQMNFSKYKYSTRIGCSNTYEKSLVHFSITVQFESWVLVELLQPERRLCISPQNFSTYFQGHWQGFGGPPPKQNMTLGPSSELKTEKPIF